jgi:hypothetical protein
MSDTSVNRLTWFVYWRWIVIAAAFSVLLLIAIPVVEFPLLLLVAIISRILGYPEFAGSLHGTIYRLAYHPVVIFPMFCAISFFVLKAVLRKAMNEGFDGKVLALKDAPAQPPTLAQ